MPSKARESRSKSSPVESCARAVVLPCSTRSATPVSARTGPKISLRRIRWKTSIASATAMMPDATM